MTLVNRTEFRHAVYSVFYVAASHPFVIARQIKPERWHGIGNERSLVMARRIASWPSSWITAPGGAGLVMTTPEFISAKRAVAIQLDYFVPRLRNSQ